MTRRRAKHAPAASSQSAFGFKSQARREIFPDLPIAAVFSFLKDTRGMLSWGVRDMGAILRISAATAGEVIPFLTMQGYVRARGAEFETTVAGETVSGSVAPHFLPQSVEASLAALTGRIKDFNRDSHAAFVVKKAVAFGDFLLGGVRAQAANVGVLLARRGRGREAGDSAGKRKEEVAFLRELRGRNSQVQLRGFEDWMEARTHRKLI